VPSNLYVSFVNNFYLYNINNICFIKIIYRHILHTYVPFHTYNLRLMLVKFQPFYNTGHSFKARQHNSGRTLLWDGFCFWAKVTTRQLWRLFWFEKFVRKTKPRKYLLEVTTKIWIERRESVRKHWPTVNRVLKL
jgi:hypothetical protein